MSKKGRFVNTIGKDRGEDEQFQLIKVVDIRYLTQHFSYPLQISWTFYNSSSDHSTFLSHIYDQQGMHPLQHGICTHFHHSSKLPQQCSLSYLQATRPRIPSSKRWQPHACAIPPSANLHMFPYAAWYIRMSL